MKKYYIILIVAFFPLIFLGQINQMEKQTNEGNFIPDTLKSLIPVSKQSLLRDVDIVFNSRIAYENYFTDDKHYLSHFNFDQLRLEVKGYVQDGIYFRFRNRYTKTPTSGSLDNIKREVDLAFLKIDLSPRTNISFGKLCADWGGYEFDFNPIDILAYNDIISSSDNFLMGCGIYHTLENKKNSFSFQLLNSRTRTYEEKYGAFAPQNINSSKYPLAFVCNWRGSFFEGSFETTYSYSLFHDAQGVNMNYLALGNKFKTKKFVLYHDFQYRVEDLDRLGIISNTINSQYPYTAENVVYLENWIRAEYLIFPKVNLLLTVMDSSHYWKSNPVPNAGCKLSHSYGVIPTFQYMPFKDRNLKIYLAYMCKKYNYSDYTKTTFSVNDYSTGFLSIGFIAPLLIL